MERETAEISRIASDIRNHRDFRIFLNMIVALGINQFITCCGSRGNSIQQIPDTPAANSGISVNL